MATTWYLCPADKSPVTNNYFAKIIGEQNPECEKRGKLCADGVHRNLYQCPGGYLDVRAAISARAEFNLKFEVYKDDSEGIGAEQVVRYDLWKKDAQRAARSANYLREFRKRLPPKHQRR